MNKISLLISAFLTAFVMVVLAGVFTVARFFTTASQETIQQLPAVTQVANVVPQTISPQEAAQIAARFMNRSDLYTVESTSLNGENAYLVIFSSGDTAYVSLQGQVLSVFIAPTNNITASSPTTSFQSNPQSSSSTSGYYEERGEHEDLDD